MQKLTSLDGLVMEFIGTGTKAYIKKTMPSMSAGLLKKELSISQMVIGLVKQILNLMIVAWIPNISSTEIGNHYSHYMKSNAMNM